MKAQKPPDRRRKGNRLQRRPFTQAELRKLFTVANGEWRGMILVSLYTGLRLGEVARLLQRDVRLHSGFIHVPAHKSGLETRPIPPPLHRHLKAIHRSGEPAQPLFQHAHALATSGRISQLSLEFRHLLVKSGVRKADPSAARRDCGDGYLPLSFAGLRYYFLHTLFSEGIPEPIAAQLFGHRCNPIPLFRIKPDLHAAVARLPDLRKISTERLQ
jgi:integrase